METLSKFFVPTIGFLVTIAFGFWLGKIGKPYNGILFNIHKLIALGTVILATVQVYKTLKGIEPQALLLISLIGVMICVLALFASGAFLSIGNVKYETVKLIHNIALVGMVITAGSSIYLLSGLGL
jgi:hypothetical protein